MTLSDYDPLEGGTYDELRRKSPKWRETWEAMRKRDEFMATPAGQAEVAAFYFGMSETEQAVSDDFAAKLRTLADELWEEPQ